MKLTGRQQQFFGDFLDLYKESNQALHYSDVAGRVGVSPMTAYDMLRLLEDRGLLLSEYVLPSNGRGRSSIVFRPTSTTSVGMGQLAGADWDRDEWNAVREHIISELRAGRGSDYQDVLEHLLLRIPERKSPMLYVADMITAVLIQLHQLTKDARDSSVLESLRSMGLTTQLSGLTVGLNFAERANRRITSTLLNYTNKYQDHLSRLSGEAKQRLSDFAEEVMRIVAP